MTNITIRVAKVKSLTGSSYVELPKNILNKKAVINIKNEDNYCFLYSVLCTLKTAINHSERVSLFKDRMMELKYKDGDMPMEINKIMYFEKINYSRINVYGLSEKSNEVVPLFASSNRNNSQFPLIQLLYYKDETNSHYCYIKDSNKLMSNCSSSKNDHHQNLVCPYCCEFQAHGGKEKEAMEKHMSYCISGQKVQMPKNDKIKICYFRNINECPIRTYADFETFNDKSMCHKSKNEQTSYNTGNRSASYELLIVSDIVIDGYEYINGYYCKSIIYKGEDSNVDFVKLIVKLEGESVQIIFDAQFKNKCKINMSEEQKQQHGECSSC